MLALTLSLLGAAKTAAAEGPSGANVISGSVGFDAAQGALNINQTSGKAIIDWSSFSIPEGFEVSIKNGSGATLNRVVGNEASTIHGLLNSTGSVYVINPNGVIVGKTGVVNTGGRFVASTLDVSNDSFLNNSRLRFRGDSNARVLNQGRISSTGGDIALIGAAVENQGHLLAPNGTAAMGAGSSLVLADSAGPDGGLLTVEVGLPETSVTNSGAIEAAAAELRAQGGNIYALAGNASGVIRATGTETRDGRIWLVSEQGATSVAGVLEASGAGGKPGEIETSGLDLKVGDAKVDTHGGTWLLDPTDLSIDSVAGASIVTALDAGTNVTERTSGTRDGYGLATDLGEGNIYVWEPLTWSGSGVRRHRL